MADKIFPLEVKADPEPIKDWASLCKDPDTFLKEVANRLVAKGSYTPDGIIISDTVPSTANRRKLWIKTSQPYGIGFVVEGSYKMDYGMSGMVPDTPFLRVKTLMDPLPNNVRTISDSEATTLGLPKLQGDIATRQVAWYIFEPAEIEY